MVLDGLYTETIPRASTHGGALNQWKSNQDDIEDLVETITPILNVLAEPVRVSSAGRRRIEQSLAQEVCIHCSNPCYLLELTGRGLAKQLPIEVDSEGNASLVTPAAMSHSSICRLTGYRNDESAISYSCEATGISMKLRPLFVSET